MDKITEEHLDAVIKEHFQYEDETDEEWRERRGLTKPEEDISDEEAECWAELDEKYGHEFR